MIDLITNNSIDYANAAPFGTVLAVGDINKFTTLQTGSVDSFDFINKIGSIYSDQRSDPMSVKQIRLEKSNAFYSFKAGIIPKKKGLYIFGTSDIPAYRQGSPKCGRANINVCKFQ